MYQLENILELNQNLSSEDKKLIKKAYDFSKRAHDGQLRKSGEPYFTHLVATAKNIADFGMDGATIAAGLLHDSVEDGVAKKKELVDNFGSEIAFLVDGVTKLGKVRYHGLKRHNESLRKLFIMTSKDLRVIIIKFCDRIHNIETLSHVREDKRLRIAKETLEIYAPLAYRLGITELSRRLEDLSFPYVYPDDYKKVVKILKERSKETLKNLEKIEKNIKKKLAEEKILNFSIKHRVKGQYSLYKKLLRKKWNADQIYDIIAIRIIVPKTSDCYSILGVIHQIYKPMVGRLKDYIANPKPNGYKSIHTTIFTEKGLILEIQIRTSEMDMVSKYGSANEIVYKKNAEKENFAKGDDWLSKIISIFQKKRETKETKKVPWLKEVALDKNNKKNIISVVENETLQENLKNDIFSHRIFVFTPAGDVIELPEESTPVDFAYLVHTEIGNKISGAKIFGKLVSLNTKLQNGDVVEVITNKEGTPNKKWLEFVKTSEAKRKIKNTLQKIKRK